MQGGADRASPLQNVGRQGLSADVRHRVLLDPQVVLPQALGCCRGGPLTAVAAHLVERNAYVHEGPETMPPLLLQEPQWPPLMRVSPQHWVPS